VKTAPGTSRVVKTPLSYTKPWIPEPS
jgi:hypothetical protein